jgi:dTMP kinase
MGKGKEVLHIREPGSTPLGEEVRGILIGHGPKGEIPIAPETEMLLYMSCRAELFKTVIKPAIEKGSFVILERSYFSTYAYQGEGLGLDGDMILKLGRWVCFGLEPHRVILLDMEVEKSTARLGRHKDRIESRSRDFHEKVRKGYLDLASRFPDLFRVVNAEGSVEEVASRVHAELCHIL